MNFIEVSVFILLLAVLSVPLASRFKVPLEIFLLIGSCIVSLIPGLAITKISPMLVFGVFLPPILFTAAYFTSWRDFKANFSAIAFLAIGLVIFTTVSVAIAVKMIFPGFTWPEAFLLGAIVSPTDATAATNLIKKLGAPRQMITILEGESLINDATALILFRFSLLAITTGSFSMTTFTMHFILSAIGGALTGLVVGYISLSFFLQQLKDVQAETTFTFLIAFISFFIAEHLGVSGVISTVVAGLYYGRHLPESAPSQTRINARASWNTLLFIINVFIFILIGAELPWVIKALGATSIFTLTMYGVVISFLIIAMRFLFIFFMIFLPSMIIKHKKYDLVTWQSFLVLGWSGMRGIVSFAAVLAIPIYIAPDVFFPHRNILIFLTYCVIVITLIVPTLTLPSLLKVFNIEKEDKLKEEASARLEALSVLLEKIDGIADEEQIPQPILIDFRKQVLRRIEMIKTQLGSQPYSSLPADFFATRKLIIAALKSERDTLLEMRKTGQIHDEVFHALTYELDLEDIRARTLRI